jgi:glycerol kinase
MAFSTLDVLRAMEADSGMETRELRVDGGAALNDWLMQFQADLIGCPVRRPASVETTALGAAGLAGIARGVWASAEEFLGCQSEPTRFDPGMDTGHRAGLTSGWRRAVRAAVSWARDGEEG